MGNGTTNSTAVRGQHSIPVQFTCVLDGAVQGKAGCCELVRLHRFLSSIPLGYVGCLCAGMRGGVVRGRRRRKKLC